MSVIFGAFDSTRKTETGRNVIGRWIRLGKRWEAFGFANSNARAIFKLLEIVEMEDLCGKIGAGELQSKIAQAKTKLKNRPLLKGILRDEIHETGDSCLRDDGTTELHPVRFVSFGLTAEDLADKLLRLEEFTAQALRKGADEIHWG